MCFGTRSNRLVCHTRRKEEEDCHGYNIYRRIDSGIVGNDSKMLGALLTSFVALYVSINRFSLTFYLDQSSKPIAFGIFVALAIRKMWKDRMSTMVENCAQKVDDVMMRVSSNSTLTRIKSSVSASSMRLMDLATRRNDSSNNLHHNGNHSYFEHRSPKIAILHSPFLSVEVIAELSLSDIKDLFIYAIEVNQNQFQKMEFLSKLNSVHLRDAINAMDIAVMASRGHTTNISATSLHQSRSNDASDIDALYFVAVVCIFAEWRSIRLVPPGYQRYGIGMGLAKRDLIQNAQKIEIAVHKYLHEQEKNYSAKVIYNVDSQGKSEYQVQCPTLRQLVQWEIESRIHAHLPKLREKSSASGLLWIHRQLRYQNAIFQNILEVPVVYPTMKVAVTEAYHHTYDSYHGFIVRKIFLSSFESTPSCEDILIHMNPTPSKIISYPEGKQLTLTTIETTKCRSSSTTSVSHVIVQNPWDIIVHHCVSEWIKIERFMKQCNGQHVDSDANRNGLIVPLHGNSTVDLSAVVFNEKEEKVPVNDFHAAQKSSSITDNEHIRPFCIVLRPILFQLGALIADLNIDDPSKC